jgi:hypothetical protein
MVRSPLDPALYKGEPRPTQNWTLSKQPQLNFALLQPEAFCHLHEGRSYCGTNRTEL